MVSIYNRECYIYVSDILLKQTDSFIIKKLSSIFLIIPVYVHFSMLEIKGFSPCLKE